MAPTEQRERSGDGPQLQTEIGSIGPKASATKSICDPSDEVRAGAPRPCHWHTRTLKWLHSLTAAHRRLSRSAPRQLRERTRAHRTREEVRSGQSVSDERTEGGRSYQGRASDTRAAGDYQFAGQRTRDEDRRAGVQWRRAAARRAW